MKNRIQNFFRRAYGFDQLSQHLYYVGIALFALSIFIKIGVLEVLSLVIIIYSLFRTLSSNRQKRVAELLKYRKFSNRFLARVKVFYLNIRHFRTHKYFVCKSCNQQLRVPRKQGNIIITCSRCRNKFEVKS